MLVYEVGIRLLGGEHRPPRALLAHSAIQQLLAWFGVVGAWVTPVVLVVTLLVWHRLERDRWRFRAPVWLGMIGEGIGLALPLLALSALFSAPHATAGARTTQLLVALGAGVYEEVVFRLLLIAALGWLLGAIVGIPRSAALPSAVVLAAILFAASHFAPIGSAAFAWTPFWFQLVAGLYLGVVFVGRGLGIAAACHAAYNMALVVLR